MSEAPRSPNRQRTGIAECNPEPALTRIRLVVALARRSQVRIFQIENSDSVVRCASVRDVRNLRASTVRRLALSMEGAGRITPALEHAGTGTQHPFSSCTPRGRSVPPAFRQVRQPGRADQNSPGDSVCSRRRRLFGEQVRALASLSRATEDGVTYWASPTMSGLYDSDEIHRCARLYSG